MSALAAGDIVLSDGTTLARVVANQHRLAGGKTSRLLTLAHSRGSLTLTPDHVVILDGEWAAARDARVGALLSSGAAIETISQSAGAVINPIVAGGTILASDQAGGAPVLAATGNEWMADVLLSAYPKYSLSFALAAAFPAATQAYYDEALEPFFNAAVPALAKLKAAAPAPLVGLGLVVGDVALAVGLGAHLLGLNGAAALAATLAAAAARRAARK